jgi:hypothetical protein
LPDGDAGVPCPRVAQATSVSPSASQLKQRR